MEEKKYGAFSSSANPEKLAATIKGLVLSLTSIIVLATPLTEVQVVELATQIGLIAGAVWTLYGAGRKIYYLFK